MEPGLVCGPLFMGDYGPESAGVPVVAAGPVAVPFAGEGVVRAWILEGFPGPVIGG